jgi:hypothetical protein
MVADDITVIGEGTIQCERIVADDGIAPCGGW